MFLKEVSLFQVGWMFTPAEHKLMTEWCAPPPAPMRSEHPELARPLKRCFLLFGHPCRLFLGPGFRLGARWNRLVKTVKTRKKREKTGKNGRDTA